MKITLNGEAYTANENQTAEGLLQELGIKAPRVAVMVNGEIVKRERRPATPIKEGDSVEVIHMVGGG